MRFVKGSCQQIKMTLQSGEKCVLEDGVLSHLSLISLRIKQITLKVFSLG